MAHQESTGSGSKGKVRFIRKNGKVIPIRSKGPGGGDGKTKKKRQLLGVKEGTKKGNRVDRKFRAVESGKARQSDKFAAQQRRDKKTSIKIANVGAGLFVGGSALAGLGQLGVSGNKSIIKGLKRGSEARSVLNKALRKSVNKIRGGRALSKFGLVVGAVGLASAGFNALGERGGKRSAKISRQNAKRGFFNGLERR